jgi:hypothetical protein
LGIAGVRRTSKKLITGIGTPREAKQLFAG